MKNTKNRCVALHVQYLGYRTMAPSQTKIPRNPGKSSTRPAHNAYQYNRCSAQAHYYGAPYRPPNEIRNLFQVLLFLRDSSSCSKYHIFLTVSIVRNVYLCYIVLIHLKSLVEWIKYSTKLMCR